MQKNYFFSFIFKIGEGDEDKFEYKRRMEEEIFFGQWGFHTEKI